MTGNQTREQNGFFMIYILLLRTLDLLTTKLAFERYGFGVSIEANSISAFLITKLGLPLFGILNVILSTMLLTYLLRFKLTNVIVKLYCIVNLMVIGINFYAIVG